MNYLELMAAYVLQKKPLLVEPTITNQLTQMAKVDQDTFFVDHRFFNVRLSYNINKSIKLRTAKLLGYTGKMVYGDFQHGILFVRGEEDLTSLDTAEYMLGGLPVKINKTRYTYKFKDTCYTEKTYVSGKKFYVKDLQYSDGVSAATMFLSKYAGAVADALTETFINRNTKECMLIGKNTQELGEVLNLADKERLIVDLTSTKFEDVTLKIKGRKNGA